MQAEEGSIQRKKGVEVNHIILKLNKATNLLCGLAGMTGTPPIDVLSKDQSCDFSPGRFFLFNKKGEREEDG